MTPLAGLRQLATMFKVQIEFQVSITGSYQRQHHPLASISGINIVLIKEGTLC